MFFFFSSRRRHTRSDRDWSSDVCSSDLGPTERIRVQLEIVGTVQIPEFGDRSFIVQAVEALRPAVRAPQVFFVFPSNEAPDIEPELRVGPGVKPQREQRDAELGRPSGTVARDGDVPNTVPALVQVVHA